MVVLRNAIKAIVVSFLAIVTAVHSFQLKFSFLQFTNVIFELRNNPKD